MLVFELLLKLSDLLVLVRELDLQIFDLTGACCASLRSRRCQCPLLGHALSPALLSLEYSGSEVGGQANSLVLQNGRVLLYLKLESLDLLTQRFNQH